VSIERAIPVCLDVDRDWLGARIDRRFDLMLKDGALEECREWMSRGYSMSLPAAKALGAPEIIAHLNGELSLDEARDAATVATRQFAKRQRTWFRSKMKDWTKLDVAALGADQAVAQILDLTQR
jgi:tRNA dimethylallyltransferase